MTVGGPRPAGPALLLALPGGPLIVPGGTYGCLLGGAGAGKTAVLRGLAAAHDHGAVQQNDTLGSGSVGAALRLALGRTGVERGQWRALEAAVLAEFDLAADALVMQLTAEQRLRGLLARALLRDPPVLLLDDPLRDIDDQAAMQALLLATQRRRGLTVVHATRRRAEAMALADHLVVLECGRVWQQGGVGALYARPATIAIARRLGTANVLPGRLVGIEDDEAMVRLDCGPLVAAEPAQDVAPGTACLVLLRPERVAVARAAAVALGEGAIAAILCGVSDRGDHVRLELAIGADTRIVAHRAAALGQAGFAVGGMVALAWQARDALVYAADTEGS